MQEQYCTIYELVDLDRFSAEPEARHRVFYSKNSKKFFNFHSQKYYLNFHEGLSCSSRRSQEGIPSSAKHDKNFWGKSGLHEAGSTAMIESSSVADPWHFGVDPDPDPRIHTSD